MADALMDRSLLSMGPAEFRLFRDLVHRHTGIWLRDGKEVMLASRLSKRLRHHRIPSFADYYDFVRNSEDGGEELGELINCVTTNKTAFFREGHHFDFLAQTVVPEILAHSRRATDPRVLRIWSAACSTGEEPWSIAITLLEAQTRTPALRGWNLQVLASDIDTHVLETARRSVYPEDELDDVSPAIRRSYFLRGRDEMTGTVKVKNHLAALVEFQRINLIERGWPLRTVFDAVFFRNALIYFRQETQDQVLRGIVRHLKPGGYLFLGHSEHIPWLHDILEPLQKTIYRVRSPKG
ncbi:MAG TPA: protein-glutamate O-methyltransferase CheR [Acidobacteriaceae bacterium]|jgi:chemotaxis protein methyltransferase CheR|nr:protein-glutamate O-methyltransferase CheR [Acidobacteriaceae bacterium]